MKARRVCAQCGTTESRWRMFKIWKGTSHDVDLCSFECSGAYYTAARVRRMGPPADLAFLMSTPEFDTAVAVAGSAVNLGEVRRQVAERERRADNCVPCLNIQPGRYGMPFQCTEPRGHDDYHKADCLGYKVIAWPIETETNDE